MSEVLFSQLYEITGEDVPLWESCYGRSFYCEEVGFGKIEEVILEDDLSATAVTFFDKPSDPFVNPGVEEVPSGLLPEEDAALIQAIRLAIKHRNQAKLFV
jgi:hypothetical protein